MMENLLKRDIEHLIRRYERQLKRDIEKELDLDSRKKNLSVHGYWSLGYHGAKVQLYQDVIDDLKEIIDKTD